MVKNSCNNKTVLITGAGGPAPMGMISVLRNWGYKIVAVDMAEKTPAFYLADAAYVVPPGGHSTFKNVLREICHRENVDAIVSVVDEELIHVAELERDGYQVIQPESDFISLCLDKYRCMNELRRHGIEAPETWLVGELPAQPVYPLLIKPIVGRGSRGIGILRSQVDLNDYLATTNYQSHELMIQEYIEGTEYTVSVIVWRDGVVQEVVPKEIICKQGVTRMAITRKNPKIDMQCRKIQEHFHANGPFNVQLRINSEGTPMIFEINPRFSTSITLTMAAGADELGGLLSQALFGRESFSFVGWNEGVVLLRGTLDSFVDESVFQKLKHL